MCFCRDTQESDDGPGSRCNCADLCAEVRERHALVSVVHYHDYFGGLNRWRRLSLLLLDIVLYVGASVVFFSYMDGDCNLIKFCDASCRTQNGESACAMATGDGGDGSVLPITFTTYNTDDGRLRTAYTNMFVFDAPSAESESCREPPRLFGFTPICIPLCTTEYKGKPTEWFSADARYYCAAQILNASRHAGALSPSSSGGGGGGGGDGNSSSIGGGGGGGDVFACMSLKSETINYFDDQSQPPINRCLKQLEQKEGELGEVLLVLYFIGKIVATAAVMFVLEHGFLHPSLHLAQHLVRTDATTTSKVFGRIIDVAVVLLVLASSGGMIYVGVVVMGDAGNLWQEFAIGLVLSFSLKQLVFSPTKIAAVWRIKRSAGLSSLCPCVDYESHAERKAQRLAGDDGGGGSGGGSKRPRTSSRTTELNNA